MAFPFHAAAGGADLSPEERDLAARLVESQGYRELAVAYIFGAGLRLAPTVDEKALLIEHAREEMEHFEAAAALYADLGAGDLLAAVDKRVAEVPVPRTWLELAVVQFLFDRAGKFQLREYRASRYAAYAAAVHKILVDEENHGVAGESLLTELCETARPGAAQAHFDRWLRVSLLSFGWPGSAASRRAVELGLKARDGADVVRDYLADLTPTMARCGLRFPPREALGLDLPDDAFPESAAPAP